MSEEASADVGPSRTSRELGRGAALFVSVGAVIGSGWLFAGFDASELSGGGSILAWVIAGALGAVLAMSYAELGSTFPVDGGVGRFPLYAFGRPTGFLSGFLSWITAVCIAPIETVASLRYASNYLPWLSQDSHGLVELSAAGRLVAAGVLLVFILVNTAGVRLFSETNSAVVWFKIAVPVIVAATLLAVHFHSGNFTEHGGPFFGGAHGITLAISQGGVVFALLGFEQAIQLGGETRNPQSNIPFAVLGSVVIAMGIYLLLQIAFIGALPEANLVDGWSQLRFAGDYGPLAGLANTLGVGWLAYLVYLAASVSPAGTGLTYTATSSRVPYALAREGYLPGFFARLNSRKVPLVSLLTCYGVGLLFLIALPSWRQLLTFATASTAVVYGLAPLSLAVLRATAPSLHRPYRVVRPAIVTRTGFVVANLILYWSGWETDRYVFAIVGIGVLIQAGLAAHAAYRHTSVEWVCSAWLVPYLGAMTIMSAVGRYGGLDLVPRYWDSAAVVVVSLAVFELAVRMGSAVHRILPDGHRPVDRWTHTAVLAGLGVPDL